MNKRNDIIEVSKFLESGYYWCYIIKEKWGCFDKREGWELYRFEKDTEYWFNNDRGKFRPEKLASPHIGVVYVHLERVNPPFN